MSFDPHAALARIRAAGAANPANPRISAPDPARISRLAGLAARLPDWPEPAGPPERWLLVELLEERAAIRQHDGGLTCPDAETGALIDIARRYGFTVESLRAIWAEERGRDEP